MPWIGNGHCDTRVDDNHALGGQDLHAFFDDADGDVETVACAAICVDGEVLAIFARGDVRWVADDEVDAGGF